MHICNSSAERTVVTKEYLNKKDGGLEGEVSA